MASTIVVDKIKGGSSGVAFTLPTSDGSAGQLLKTDGSATLSWATDIDTGITSVAADTTPQLGGNLDLNNNNITGIGDIPAGNLTGNLPAIDGSALTGISTSTNTKSVVSVGAVSEITFTSIPSGVNRIQVGLYDVTNASVTTIEIQLGTSSGYVTTGYESWMKNMGGGSFTTYGEKTGAMYLSSTGGNTDIYGVINLVRVNSNDWSLAGNSVQHNDTMGLCAGRVSLGGSLDRLKIKPSSGNFASGGYISIVYD